MEEALYTINVRVLRQNFSIQISPKKTISDLKQDIIKQIDYDSTSEYMIIFGGKIQSDDSIIGDVLKDNSLIFVIQKPKKEKQQEKPNDQQGQENSNQSRNIQTDQNTPSYYGTTHNTQSPRNQTPDMIDTNAIQTLLQNPGLMQQILQMYNSNPQLFQNLSQSFLNQRGNSNTQNLPNNMDILNLLRDPVIREGAARILRNPDIINQSNLLDRNLPFLNPNENIQQQQPDSIPHTIPSNTLNTEELEGQYADQLVSLNSMGFYNKTENLIALEFSGGDVNMAVELLLGNLKTLTS